MPSLLPITFTNDAQFSWIEVSLDNRKKIFISQQTCKGLKITTNSVIRGNSIFTTMSVYFDRKILSRPI